MSNAVINIRDFKLTKYDAVCRAIAEALEVDEVLEIRDDAMRLHACARIAKNKEVQADAMEYRGRTERRLGEIIKAQKETVGLNTGALRRGSKVDPRADLPTLAQAGIDKHLAHEARKLAAMPEDKFAELIEKERTRILSQSLIKDVTHGTQGTGNNEWFTPDEYLEAARLVLGAIDLDPASSNVAQKAVRAERYFTKDDDGLKHEWFGRVWLNPPYAQPAMADFVSKMVAEWKADRVEAAIMLTHNYTDTAWFHEAAPVATAICFTSGRIRFVDTLGDRAAPTQGQVFFYFGPDVDVFGDVFGQIGWVCCGV